MKRKLLSLLALLFAVLLSGFALSEVLVDGGVALDDDIMVEYGCDYSTKEEVALYLHAFRQLPPNYLTKYEAMDWGWESRDGNLWDVAYGMSIGGDKFGNFEGLLPKKKGRQWYECDVEYNGGFRGKKRILFSSDGLVYYSGNHYKNFTELYDGWYDLGDGGEFTYGVDDWSYEDDWYSGE